MNVSVGFDVGLPAEIAFLARHGVPSGLLFEAAQEAARLGVAPSHQVLASGLVCETAFYRALADACGLAFRNEPPPLRRGGDVAAILREGVARTSDTPGSPVRFAVAPHGPALRRFLAGRPHGREDIVVVPHAALASALRRTNAAALARSSAWLDEAGLGRLSARNGSNRAQRLTAHAGLGFLSFTATLEPLAALIGAALLTGPLFLGLTALRLAAVLEAPAPDLWRDHGWQVDDSRLPVYTVAVPLFGEQAVLDQLIGALSALDYPAAKLDIRLLIEEVDLGLRRALEGRALPPFMQVMIVPAGQPQTKPRALNVALAEARGALFTIYDAEDVPEPRQLRMAAERFLAAGPDLVCLQARLVIDNTEDGVLPGLFALEYAGLFDVLNPGLLRSHLPILLGGTSNHFRTEALRHVGGWDAWNVTEDADIGIRLVREGGRIADLPSATFEEAPLSLKAWLKQRTRWMKGYLQTMISHLQDPAGLVRKAGLAETATFLALALGTFLSALGYPFFAVAMLVACLNGSLLNPGDALTGLVAAGALTLSLGGLLAMMLPPAVGAWRRGAIGLWRWIPLLPLYYLLVSLAAWLAMVEYVTRRFAWNKTAHGLARSSRYRQSRQPGS